MDSESDQETVNTKRAGVGRGPVCLSCERTGERRAGMTGVIGAAIKDGYSSSSLPVLGRMGAKGRIGGGNMGGNASIRTPSSSAARVNSQSKPSAGGGLWPTLAAIGAGGGKKNVATIGAAAGSPRAAANGLAAKRRRATPSDDSPKDPPEGAGARYMSLQEKCES